MEVLVLNQNYQPLNITSRRRAIVLLYLNKANRVYDGNDSVIRLNYQVRIPTPDIHPTRKGIFTRDDNKCVYCGTTGKALTLDHVVPRSRGGKNTWENLVCCCMLCNNFKGDRTLDECSLTLEKKPRKPNYIQNMSYHKFVRAANHDEWADFLAPFMM